MQKSESSQSTFNGLFEAESDAIFRFCLVRVSDREQAMDIIQETFMRLWRKLQEGTEMTNARAFLFTVSHNLIIDWYRKKKALPFRNYESEEDSEEGFEPADQGTVDGNLELSAEGRYLLGSISKIRSLYRRAVYLKYVEGLTPPEIGKALGIPTNTASVRVHRGIRELKRLLHYDIPQRASLPLRA